MVYCKDYKECIIINCIRRPSPEIIKEYETYYGNFGEICKYNFSRCKYYQYQDPKELEVGTIFNYDNIKLIVTESNKGKCKGCYFNDKDCLTNSLICNNRNDKKSVIFKKL